MAQNDRLHDRQRWILTFIQEYIAANGFPPTIREIGRDVGISSTSVVNYHLEALEQKGYIERERYVARGLRLVNGDEMDAEMDAEMELLIAIRGLLQYYETSVECAHIDGHYDRYPEDGSYRDAMEKLAFAQAAIARATGAEAP